MYRLATTILAFLTLSGAIHAQIYVAGSGSQFGTMDPTTGAFSSIGSLSGATTQLSGMAFGAGPLLYGVAGLDGTDTTLYRVSTGSGATVALRSIGAAFVSVAARSDGVLFGYTTSFDGNGTPLASTLWRIDPINDTLATSLGPLGIATLDGLSFAPDGQLYTSLSSTGNLYRLDTTTGAASAVGGGVGTMNLTGYAVGGSSLFGFADDRTVRPINTTTGAGGSSVSYSFGPSSPLDFVTAAASAVVPEPSALALLLIGGGAAVGYRRGRRKRA
jgi:hypothetical protein